MRKTILVLTSVMLMGGIAGCTTVEQSATIGGLTGAAIGGAATGRVGGAVAGGVIGAMVGALVGKHAESGMCEYVNPWGYRYRAWCPPGR